MLVTLVCHPLSVPKPTAQSSSLRHHVLRWTVRKTTTKRGSGGRGSQVSCSKQARPCSPSPSDHSLHLPSPDHVPFPSLVLEKSSLSPGLADEGVPGPSCLLPEPQVGAEMFHTNPRSQEFLLVCAEDSPHNIPASELVFSYQTAPAARAPEPNWKQPS